MPCAPVIPAVRCRDAALRFLGAVGLALAVFAGPAQAQQDPAVHTDQAPAGEVSADTGGAGMAAAAPAPLHTDLPQDLTPVGMYRAAHPVVKAVMIGLVLASLATWTIWLAKSVELAAARRRLRGTLRAVRAAHSLDEAIGLNGKRRGPGAAMLHVARHEAGVSEPALDAAGGEGLKERVAAALGRIEAGAGRRMSVGTGVLATVGSVAPFVGLFGTVWGIMNAFIGISHSKTTNLAVVAPGIAEALLATAIGLVAAIPAVVIYNHFARATARYRALLADTSTGVSILVSRDLDFRAARRREE